MPNTASLPPESERWRRVATRRHLLFVGNLSYLPNVDGIARFAREALPRLRSRFGDDLVLRIAGSTPVAEVMALALHPGIEVLPDLPEVAPSYAWADLAAGGGTRIKLLEAFAHGVPVVATAIGAEGVDARDGTHLVIADAPAAFAEACALLLEDACKARSLAAAARALVETRYAHESGVRAVRRALEPMRP